MSIERETVVETYTDVASPRSSTNVGMMVLLTLIVIAVAVTAIMFATSQQGKENKQAIDQLQQNQLLDQLKPAETPQVVPQPQIIQAPPQVIQSPPQVIQVPVPHEVKVPVPVAVPTPAPAPAPKAEPEPAPAPEATPQ